MPGNFELTHWIPKKAFHDFLEECSRCRGERWVPDPMQSAGPYMSTPPRTIWCYNCAGTGFVFTQKAIELLNFLQVFGVVESNISSQLENVVLPEALHRAMRIIRQEWRIPPEGEAQQL